MLREKLAHKAEDNIGLGQTTQSIVITKKDCKRWSITKFFFQASEVINNFCRILGRP